MLASYKVVRNVRSLIPTYSTGSVGTMNIMAGEPAGKLLLKAPLSNGTISRRIQHTTEDISNQSTEKLKKGILDCSHMRLQIRMLI